MNVFEREIEKVKSLAHDNPCSAQDHVRAPQLFEQLGGSGLL